MCQIYSDEAYQTFRETPRVARKAHRCTCCRRIIAVGEQYTDHYSMGDGPSRGKLCAECLRDRDSFAAAHENLTATPDGFESLLQGCIADGDPESERVWQPVLDRITESREAIEAKR